MECGKFVLVRRNSLVAADQDRHYWSTATFKPSAALLTSIEDIMIEEIQAVRHIKGNRPTMIVQPINLDEISMTQKNGGNPLGIAVEDGPLVCMPTLLY